MKYLISLLAVGTVVMRLQREKKKTTATKENVNPNTKSATTSSKPTATQKSYQCPFCDKIYHFTSGFRGHVTKNMIDQMLKVRNMYFFFAPIPRIFSLQPLFIKTKVKRGCWIRNHERFWYPDFRGSYWIFFT